MAIPHQGGKHGSSEQPTAGRERHAVLILTAWGQPAIPPAECVFRANLARTGAYPGAGPSFITDTVIKFTKPGDSAFGIAICSPAVAGGVAYFGANDSNYYAVDLKSGKELWHFKTPNGIFDGSPTVAGDRVYLPGPDKAVHALDRMTGEEKQHFAAGDIVGWAPALLDGKLYYGSQDGYLYAHDIVADKEIWKYKAGHWIGSPAIADRENQHRRNAHNRS